MQSVNNKLSLAVLLAGIGVSVVFVYQEFFLLNDIDQIEEENLTCSLSEVNNNILPDEEVKAPFNPANLKWELVTAQAPFAKRDAHNVIVFKDKIWLLGGVGGTAPDYSKNFSDVWNSEDGKNWTLVTDKAPWGPRRAGEILVFKDKIWLC